VWLVTDGTARRDGWQELLVQAWQTRTGVVPDVLSAPGLVAETARGILESGADAVLRLFRLHRGGEESGARELYERHRPQLVLADHPGVFRWLQVLRDALGHDSLHVGLVAEWSLPVSWLQARPDGVVAPDGEQLVALQRAGMPPQGLQQAGPLVGPAWRPEPEQAARARATLGVGEQEPVVLIDATTLPPADIDRLVGAMSTRPMPRVLAYWGQAPAAARVLRQAAEHYRVPVRLFGWVPDEPAWFQAVDLVIQGEDPVRAAQVLALGTPVVSVQPTTEPTWPVRSGAMVPVPDPRSAADVLSWVATSGVAPTHRSAAAALAGVSDPAGVVEAVLALWAERVMLRAAAPAPPASAGPVPSTHGPVFEDVGGAGATLQPGPAAAPPSGEHPREHARRQLANLILEERRVERELSARAEERDRWMERLDLARQSQDAALIQAAQARVDTLVREVAALGTRLASLDESRRQVRQQAARAAGGTGAAGGGSLDPLADPLEETFRRMEQQRALDRLRQQQKDEDADA
jgi:hypothetical protein